MLQDITPITRTMEEKTFHEVDDTIEATGYVSNEKIEKLDKELAEFQSFMENERIAEEAVPTIHNIR